MRHVNTFVTFLTAALLLALSAGLFAQPGKYVVLGKRSCNLGQGNCHQADGKWWEKDPHFGTVNDLDRKKNKSKQIARLYGMSPNDYKRGNTICATCHGEVVGGREKSNMSAGVSCESCHGPAGPQEGAKAGYFAVHQEGANPGDPLDESRSGYQKSLKVGLLRLRDVNVRAKVCVDCHQIDNKRLLEAGHPSGEGFDYVNKGIVNNISRHWDYKLRSADKDSKPYEKAVAKKPIPEYESKQSGGGSVAASSGGSGPPRYIYITRDPDIPNWLNPDKTIQLEFSPINPDTLSVEEILLLIKQRIETIHKKISGKDEQ